MSLGGCNSRGVSRHAVTQTPAREHPAARWAMEIREHSFTPFSHRTIPWYAFDVETHHVVLLTTSVLCPLTVSRRRGVGVNFTSLQRDFVFDVGCERIVILICQFFSLSKNKFEKFSPIVRD